MQPKGTWARRVGPAIGRRRFVGAGVALTGAAAFAAACRGEEKKATQATTAPGQGTQVAAAQPQRGGVMRVIIPNVFDSVDVHRAFGDPTSWLSNYILNKIVRYKNPDTGEIEPDLAQSYEVPDAANYVFKLRQDVKWQSNSIANGRQFTAEDVKWHFERQAIGKTKDGMDVSMRFGAFYKTITKIETPDRFTVRVTLDSPNGSFLDRLAAYFSTVPNREATEKFENDHRTLTEEAMPATGPFLLGKWRSGQEIVMKRNPDHFRKEEPLLDGWIAPLLFEDPNAYRAAFEQKQVDSFSSPDPSVTKAIIDSNRATMTEVLTGVGNTVALIINTNKPPFSKDPRLARAMNMAFDRRAAIQTFHQGLGQVSGPVTWIQEAFAIPRDELIKLEGYRTDRELEKREARQLWQAAGGPGLGEIDITIPRTWLANWPDTTQIIPKMFNDNLGVTQFKSTPSDYNENIIPNLFNGQFPSWFGWVSQVNSPDPRADFRNNFHSKGSVNINKINNPELDKLIDEAVATADRQKAIDLLLKAQKILFDNGMYGLITLYNYISRSAIWNYLRSATLKEQGGPGKPATGYAIFSGYLVGKTWIDTKDASYQGRPPATVN
jgi:peptide/nickel transport system substrate-binding protein